MAAAEAEALSVQPYAREVDIVHRRIVKAVADSIIFVLTSHGVGEIYGPSPDMQELVHMINTHARGIEELTVSQVEELIRHLQHFVDKGRLEYVT